MSINVVNILMNNPIIVIKFGASQSGHLPTSQHHQGCKNGSSKLTFVQLYLCSDSFFNCGETSNLFLYVNIFNNTFLYYFLFFFF